MNTIHTELQIHHFWLDNKLNYSDRPHYPLVHFGLALPWSSSNCSWQVWSCCCTVWRETWAGAQRCLSRRAGEQRRNRDIICCQVEQSPSPLKGGQLQKSWIFLQNIPPLMAARCGEFWPFPTHTDYPENKITDWRMLQNLDFLSE